jgi:hypothetical protein
VGAADPPLVIDARLASSPLAIGLGSDANARWAVRRTYGREEVEDADEVENDGVGVDDDEVVAGTGAVADDDGRDEDVAGGDEDEVEVEEEGDDGGEAVGMCGMAPFVLVSFLSRSPGTFRRRLEANRLTAARLRTVF